MSPDRVASRSRSALSICVVMLLAGAAWFAVPSTAWAVPLEGTGPVTDTVEEALPDTGGVTEPIEDTVEEALPDTGGATQPIEDTVEETISDPGGATQPIVDTVEETISGGGGTDLIDDLSGTATKAVESTEGGTLDEVTGPVADSLDRTVAVSGDSPKDGNKTHGRSGSGGLGGTRTLAERFPHEFASTLNSAGGHERILRIAPVSTPAPSGPGLLERIGQDALDAAKKVAFPIALMFAAGAFMVVQGRIDRREPKLAAAPIEIDEHLLRFE